MESMKARNLLVIAAVALFATACTMTKLVYNNATPVLTWMADDYFDLSGPQEEWVRDRLKRAVGWHRGAELPEYERFLRETLARTDRPITIEDARWAHQGLRNYYNRLVGHLIPDAAEFLGQLEPGQAEHFARRFEEDNAKIRREQGKTDARGKERRAHKMIDTIEGYTGRLSREQKALVLERVSAMKDVTALRLEDRKLRQQRLVELIREKPPKAKMEAALRQTFIDTESWRKAEFLRMSRQRDEELLQMVVELAATLTPEQMAHVQKKIRNYVKDVGSLMAMN